MENHHHHESKECCDKQKINELSAMNKMKEKWDSYKPLLIILIFCSILSLVQKGVSHPETMYSFMGYFFVFLSLFKFFDLQGFVDGFSTYDLLTKKFRAYGYAYPFMEFLLGIAYLSTFDHYVVNWITFVMMTISGLGVIKSIYSGQEIKCVCLGTTLNVPLSTVSVLENLGMGGMAFMMALFG